MGLQLSKRLQTIADFIPARSRVVDVGTDHALLPIYLVTEKACPIVIATDISEGPARVARANVQSHGVHAQVSVRLGPGLTTVTAGEVDTCVIAGMGGATAEQILKESPDVVTTLGRVLIQPMNAAHRIRSYLLQENIGILDERVVYEDGRFYTIIVADRAAIHAGHYAPFAADEAQIQAALAYGPMIARRTDELSRSYLSSERSSIAAILVQLEQGQHPSTKARRRELGERMRVLNLWLGEAPR